SGLTKKRGVSPQPGRQWHWGSMQSGTSSRGGICSQSVGQTGSGMHSRSAQSTRPSASLSVPSSQTSGQAGSSLQSGSAQSLSPSPSLSASSSQTLSLVQAGGPKQSGSAQSARPSFSLSR